LDDPATESQRLAQAALEVLMRGRTTVVVTHRLSTIENADGIVVLDRARVAVTGTRSGPLERSGIYDKPHSTRFAPA
jgi:ATP-binding cassette, subfamily B, bacterial MsbA